MTRRSRIMLAALVLMLASAAPSSRLDAQEPSPPPARTPDPLDVFVPHEKVDADSIVAFPVDI